MTESPRRPRSRRGDEDVFQITAAPKPLTEDVGGRTRRYLISMAVRTVCVVGAVLVGGWLRWAFLAGAVLLPYVAVVLANGGREPNRDLPTAFMGPQRPMLEAPRPEADRRDGGGPAGARPSRDDAA
ncbi:MAG: DUF3099 domain-containing protein [Motilibacteraceae bacterium]